MTLPLLPTTGVGSFPKPDYVKGSRGYLDDNSKRATQEFIRRQEGMDIDVLVDGEFYRGDMATDYARALGLSIAEWTRSYDNRFWRKGKVDQPLERTGMIQVEQFEYAQSLTQRPVKGMLTGPTTLANWNFDNHYGDRENLVLAWADVIRQEALALQGAGAQYIQIDEPAIGERPYEAELFREGLRRAREGVNAYIITHLCYGDFVRFYDSLKDLPVDQIDIELANDLDLGLKNSRLLQRMREYPLTKHMDVAVGVVDVRPYIGLESDGVIERRIEVALPIFAYNSDALKRVWVKPDCGFRTTKDIDVSYGNMQSLVTAVERVRSRL